MARKLPSLNALRAFEAAARHGSFVRAAEELHVSHAAVSRHIRELEAALGIELFRRFHRGVQVTAAGERYGRVVAESFDRIAAATVALRGDSDAEPLVVSVDPAFASRWLVPRLGGFRSEHGDIDVVIDPTTRLVDFRAEPVDLGIRYGRGRWAELSSEHLIDVVAFPVCAPSLATRLATPDDLRDHVLLHEETGKGWADWLNAAGVAGVATGRGAFFHDASLVLDAAVAGQGVALGDNVLAAMEIAAGRLMRPFARAVPYGGYYLVALEAVPDRPAAAAFRRWLKAEMAAFAAPAPP